MSCGSKGKNRAFWRLSAASAVRNRGYQGAYGCAHSLRLFDVSHMGELVLSGPDALRNVQRLTCNDCSGMYDGQVRYSPMCNEQGGVVDDILVYRLHETAYLLVVNAAQ